MALEIERRWLIIPEPWPWPAGLLVSEHNIAQTSLQHPEEAAGVIERVRTRLHVPGGYGDIVDVHTHTVKHPTGQRLVRREDEREITEAQLQNLIADRKHPDCCVINKVRRTFEWKGKTFELDSLMKPEPLHILECELDSEDEDVTLPPFLRVIREVTEEPGWTNSEIARKDWKHPDRLIPGVALDRLVWKSLHLHAEDVEPPQPPHYSTDIYEAERLLDFKFRKGHPIDLHRLINGVWTAHQSRFFWDEDVTKRHYDNTTFSLSGWGLTLAHAIAVCVAVNGINDLEDSEWHERWAWEWGNDDEPPAIKDGSRLT